MPKIFVARSIPDQGIKMLKAKKYAVSIYPKDEIIPRKELLKRVKGCDALLSILTDKIDTKIFSAAGPQLKIVANYAVGFDNIDLAAAKKRSILVTNTPGPEISEAVAEHTIALMFALAHRLVEADQFVTARKYHGWGPTMLMGSDVMGKTLGLIGSGRIGSFLVRRLAAGFGLKIIYNDVKRNDELEKKFNCEYRSKMDLLRQADFVSLHVPLLPSTRHLISKKEFKAMKKTAFLINTARGPIVNTSALIQALKQQEIGGAALDVFECEPFIACNPTDIAFLRKAKNVILTPHTASATVEARQAMSRAAAINIIEALEGRTPPNAVR